MLHSGELVAIDVEGNARPSVAHLSRDRDDIRAVADKMGTECVSKIVQCKLRPTFAIEAGAIRRLRKRATSQLRWQAEVRKQ